jgi:N6-L-threonylcarbamoyladenine synthase
MTRILGIESSCDETGLAIVEDGVRVISNEIASQVPIHTRYGGVVPEIASRHHLACISAMFTRIMEVSGTDRVDAVAATNGPGLMGSLLVGVNFAKALAMGWGVPFVPVHHIEGHMFSAFLTEEGPQYPFLSLVVSGGHTCLLYCETPHHYTLLGTTRDDAVGECFDKVARLLHLPYPGGPSIQKAAEGGNPKAYRFPRAMMRGDTLDFSYSGLKTSVLYELRERPEYQLNDLAASFQMAAVDVLVSKTRLAIAQTNAPRLVVAGGVAANKLLRERLQAELRIPVLLPPLPLCLDNGAMIAAAGYSRLQHGFIGSLRDTPDANLRLF